MARFLVQNEWFEQVAPTAMYEGEFETIFLQNSTLVFPDFHVVPFKAIVTSAYGNGKPDLALIDRQYRSWWVVEVELAIHSLLGHVAPQVQIFSTAEYGPSHAQFLCARNRDLNYAAVEAMLKGHPPQVLVIVNAPRPEWVPVLRRYNTLVTVFEVFRSKRGQQVFRLNGEQPTLRADILTECEFDRWLPKFLRLTSPATFPALDNEFANLFFEGAVTRWKRVDAQNAVWLVPVGPNPLPSGFRYEIVRDEAGTLSIQPTKKRR